MTFDFSFDLSVLDQANTTGKTPNVEEQASLSLLRRFLQNSDSPQMAQWQHLQQQLADVFLPYMALFDADNWWSYQGFLNASMLEIKQQLLYKDQEPKKRLQLPHSLSIAVWQKLLQTMKISEHLVGADVDGVQHLATLCASLPCHVGYAEVCSIAALNCFEVRTELQISDLVHMAAMLSGTDDVKMDLAQLVTLDIRLPSWSWSDVVLQCELADTEDSKLSLKQLEKQLTAQHLKPANDPATDLLALFALAQQVGQQKIQHTRQLLSSMTHVLLDEDALSNQLQQSAQELQKALRQQVTALQSNAEQMEKCCGLFEADLQKLFPHYVKDNSLLQEKKNNFFILFDKNKIVGTFEWLQSAAEQGDAEAQNQLGDMYEEGQGVIQNDQEAVRWYRKAAEQGATNAQCNLGRRYKEGQGVAQNDQEAVSWYRKAAEQGAADAQSNLGWMYQKGRGVTQNYQDAVGWYRKAAEQGKATAQYFLGSSYQQGRGVAQNDQEAANWYRKAAEQGAADAQSNLGWMYQEGRGVTQNDQEAVSWYRKAAEQGDADAQSNLGWMYQEGRGVTQNDEEAVSWYRKAAEQGDADAQSNLGWMYQEGRGVTQNDEEAVSLYRKAAKQGHADAQFNVGWMYQEGRGVTQNDQEAVRWYRKAAEQGHVEASACLGNIMKKVWYDPSTNLTWMSCSLGQVWDGATCIGIAKKYTWDEAQQAVAEMNRNGGYTGYTDWVLPDIEALKSILRDHAQPPKIDHTVFPNTASNIYWSASPYANRSNYAWYVDFHSSYTGYYAKSYYGHVRAVRAGR